MRVCGIPSCNGCTGSFDLEASNHYCPACNVALEAISRAASCAADSNLCNEEEQSVDSRGSHTNSNLIREITIDNNE